MNQITSPQDVAQLGTILSVWAHPDDETYSAAGILSAAVANGQTVTCVTATQGEAGVKYAHEDQKDHLGQVRADEMKEALKIIGIKECQWLGCADGACDKEPAEKYISLLAEVIRENKPNTILTFGPDGWTGHGDHKAVSRWVSEAVKRVDFTIQVYWLVTTPRFYEEHLKEADKRIDIFFNIDEPPLLKRENCEIYLRLHDSLLDQKVKALHAMSSQTDFVFERLGEETVRDMVSLECFCKS